MEINGAVTLESLDGAVIGDPVPAAITIEHKGNDVHYRVPDVDLGTRRGGTFIVLRSAEGEALYRWDLRDIGARPDDSVRLAN